MCLQGVRNSSRGGGGGMAGVWDRGGEETVDEHRNPMKKMIVCLLEAGSIYKYC